MPLRRAITGRSQEPRKRYREELRALRLAKGLTLRQLGEVMGWDWSHFGKMESGETLGSPEVAQALDQFYGAQGFLLVLWELAAGDHTQFKKQYQRFMALESESIGIHQYATSVVPGLLQTAAYSRSMLMLGGLRPGDELDKQVGARMSRRDVLWREDAAQFRVILDEAVFHRPLTDTEEWREQLRHLIVEAERPNVDLQVLPFSAGLHGLINTETAFLRLLDGQTVAWVETGFDGKLVEEPTEVERLQRAYDQMRDQTLTPSASVEFVKRVLEELPCPSPEST